MEIHSSSLRSPPISYNRLKVDKPDAVKNKPEQEELKLAKNKRDQQSPNAEVLAQTPAEIEKTLAQDNLQFDFNHTLNDSLTKPFNKRVQQALNAYTAQLNQPIIHQRTELIAGIDFYI